MAALRDNFSRVKLLMLTSDALKLICPFAHSVDNFLIIYIYVCVHSVCLK